LAHAKNRARDGGAALGGVLAGLSTWVGAAREHADVPLSSMFDAGLNVAVPALLIFGVGVLALAVVPRMVSVVTYAVLVWFLLVEILGSVVTANHWILDLSGYHQMAAAPAVAVNWSANAVMIALAVGPRASVSSGSIGATSRANDPPRCSVHGVARVASFREFAPVIGQREQDDQCRNAHDRGSDQERFVHP